MDIKNITKAAKRDLILLKKDYTIIKSINNIKIKLKNKVIQISNTR